MNVQGKDMKIFAGNSNLPLAEAISESSNIPLGKCLVSQFSDGEISVDIQESVRGSDVFVIQSTSDPVNRNLMELLIMIDAVCRASAGRVTAVVPYYGYARQDRKSKPRDPITAKLVANLITQAGADRVLTMDLHAAQIQGFFDIPVDHLYGIPILAPYFEKMLQKDEAFRNNLVIMSPDLGSVNRARTFALRVDAPLAIIDKRRPKPNSAEVMHVIGDIEGKDVLIVDDMIDTAGTLVGAAKEVMRRGANRVAACATHAVLSGPAMRRLEESPLEEVVVLDTICLPEEKKIPKIKPVSCAPLLSEAMMRTYTNKPISVLFT